MGRIDTNAVIEDAFTAIEAGTPAPDLLAAFVHEHALTDIEVLVLIFWAADLVNRRGSAASVRRPGLEESVS